MQIQFIAALKIIIILKSLKRISFSCLGKAQKTSLSMAVVCAKNFLICGRCPQALCYCSEVLPSPSLASRHSYNISVHPPSHLQRGACKHGKLSQAL